MFVLYILFLFVGNEILYYIFKNVFDFFGVVFFVDLLCKFLDFCIIYMRFFFFDELLYVRIMLRVLVKYFVGFLKNVFKIFFKVLLLV